MRNNGNGHKNGEGIGLQLDDPLGLEEYLDAPSSLLNLSDQQGDERDAMLDDLLTGLVPEEEQ